MPGSFRSSINPLTIILITVGFMICYALVFDPKIDLNGDNASYYILGKALNMGEGYININSVFKSPNNHFPPGYPFLLSIIMIISDSFIAIKLMNGLFFLLSLFLSFVLVRKITDNKIISWLVILFLLLNTHLLRYSTIMMTEIPFLFFSILSIYFFFSADNREDRRSYIYYGAAFAAFITAFYIRTLGIALLGPFIVVMIFDLTRKWKIIASYIVGFILLFLPWWLRGRGLGGNSYLKQLVMINPYRPELGQGGIGDFGLRVVKNFERYVAREIPDVIFPFKTIHYREAVTSLEWIFGILLILIIALGLWNLTRYKKQVLGYIGCTFAVLLLWPDVWVGVRFVLPLLPFLLLLFINGLQSIIIFIQEKIKLKSTLTLWLILVLLFPFIPDVIALNQNARQRYNRKWHNYFEIARWFKRSELTDVVVSCRKPAMFYLFSGTYTTRYMFTQDDGELLEDLIDRKANYVVVDQLGYSSTIRYLYPAIQNNPDRFKLVTQIDNPDTYLLKFITQP